MTLHLELTIEASEQTRQMVNKDFRDIVRRLKAAGVVIHKAVIGGERIG